LSGKDCRATTAGVTGTVSGGANQIGDAAKAWEAARADPAIQYAPVDVVEKPPKPPGWLEAFLKWLGELFEPLGRAFGSSWPVVKWILLALAVAAVLLLLWRLFGPALGWRPRREAASEDDGWTPDAGAALALLEDADRLAGEGRYDEATHLLLRRSVGQIAAARPEWVEPATTARELAAFEELPSAARHAFATIAERVERSLFALKALGEDDWLAARAAYADFALARLPT
jgi:hypothetical protein